MTQEQARVLIDALELTNNTMFKCTLFLMLCMTLGFGTIIYLMTHKEKD